MSQVEVPTKYLVRVFLYAEGGEQLSYNSHLFSGLQFIAHSLPIQLIPALLMLRFKVKWGESA